MRQKILFIGLVWPEPEATAAGIRILQLVDFFQYYNCEVIFCSTAKKSELSYDFSKKNVQEIQIELNNASFNDFIKELSPNIVVFDRFLTEEQFGWRVEDHCPEALKILDTEDLHFLRKGRLSKSNIDYFENDVAKREIASIFRCDLSLIISEFEMKLLYDTFNIPSNLLMYLPFLEDSMDQKTISNYPDFNSRAHFISIGNFKHEPNWRAVLKLKNDIWPLIRKKLPQSELHIYGAYATQKVFDLHNPAQGFMVKGWVDDIQTVFSSSRVCLAPIDFGAGIKGKLLYSMKYGTPNITTEIGAEGMQIEKKWNGFIENSIEGFTEKAVELYTNEALWKDCQTKGIEIYTQRFGKEQFYPFFWKTINSLRSALNLHRSKNFIGAMLRYHTNRSTKFLSKYITLKNEL